nr:uncharacterized protein LOC113403755 [Vanessa tameamea]
MKKLVGIAFLMFVIAHHGTAQESVPLFNVIKAIGIDYVSDYIQDFFNDNCPGLCLPQPISYVCQIVYTNAGCPSSRHCCVYKMRIDINTPNRTVTYPLTDSELTVNIPEDTTITVEDKETSLGEY